MIYLLARAHRARLTAAYSVSTAGNIAGQLYPLATGLAINGVLQKQYWAIGWLIACHFIALALEVSAKMLDTRVFTRIYSELASSLVIRLHREGTDPSLIASRSALSREYIAFLERDVPELLLSIVSLTVALSALLWLDSIVAMACLALVPPLVVVNRWLAKRSSAYNVRLNDLLESEVKTLQEGHPHRVARHFKALSGWRVRLSDAEAKAFGAMELFVIVLFVAALWRLAAGGEEHAGDIYAVFAYVWKFVLALDHVPQLVQQLAKLRDLNGRLRERQAPTEIGETCQKEF